MAASLKVGPDAVAVTGVTDVARRRLLGSGAAVAFTVSVSSASAASIVASGITAVAADSSAFVSALNSNLAAAGLPACSGVAVSPPVLAEPPALNLSSVNLSAAVSAVATSFTNLSASAAAEKQTQLLSSLSVGTSNVTFSQESASAAASLVLAVVSAAPGVVLSLESQSAALNVLAAVSNAKIDAASGVGQTIASALDSVASSAVSGGNPAALAAVQGVINNLAAGQAASLLENMDMTPGAPPPAPATTSTPTIQTLVQVDPPGSNRLTTKPLSAPGSASSFAPMPEGLLPGDKPVVTQFFSLKFDPNGGSTAGGAESNSGVTRLAFTNPDGSAVPVTNAATPILFALPRVSLDPDSQAMCTYWDPVTKTYPTHGCIGVPNPQPPNHTLAFIPGYQTPDDTSLANAWNISGPMVDDGLCNAMVIDCNSDAPCNGTVVGRACKVYPNPRNPLKFPAVACPPLPNATNSSAANATTPLQPVLRVFYGQYCPLWQDNDYNCSWDNIKQSFNGGGCVSAGDSTQCMCRHLTDFAAARKPKIATCSASDMMALNPGDIVTKLKFLFIVVIVLFGFMNVGAVIAFILDMNEHKNTLALLQQPEMGFVEHDDGTWTWTCVQKEMRNPVEAPSGSAFRLATVFGLPFVRLRAALPEAMFAGSVGRALGRRAGLSVTGLVENAEFDIKAMKELAQALSCFAPSGRSKIPEFDAEADAASPKTPKTPPSPTPSGGRGRAKSKDKSKRSRIPLPSRTPTGQVASPGVSSSSLVPPEPARWPGFRQATHAKSMSPDAATSSAAIGRQSQLVGTALVFAFMSNTKTLPVAELAKRTAAASEHLAGVRLPGIDRGFDELLGLFKVMLSPGNLSSRGDWLEKSRLWRLILLQRSDGGFDINESLAFALQAHEGAVPPREKPTSKLRQLIAAFLEDDDLDDVIDEGMSDDESDKVSVAEEEEEKLRQTLGGHVNDCPLSFSSRAVQQRLPKALARINKEREARNAAAAAAAEAKQRREERRVAAELASREQSRARDFSLSRAITQAVEQQHAALLHAPLKALFEDASRGLERLAGSLAGSPAASGVTSPAIPSSPPPGALSPREVAGSIMPSMAPSAAPSGAVSRRMRAPLPVDRVWATVLALEVLKEFDSTWLLDDDAPEPWRTVVDGAAEYLRAQAKQDKRLYTLVKSGELTEAADKARKDWNRIQAANVAAIRNADVINKFTLLTHLQRASARVVRSVMTDHGTFATFLDTEGYIMRWQRLMILVTLVLSTLLTSIWFYYSRGANCCIEIRTILNCDPVGECMGFNGDCGDIQSQFSGVQGPYVYGTPPEEHMYLDDYVCTAFPDDAYITDQMLVGLISVAVALPVDLFLARAFEIANEGDAPESWLEAPAGKWKWVVGKNGHNDWRLNDPKVPISDLVLWLIRYGEEPIYAIVFRLVAWLRRKLRAKLWGPEPEEEEEEDKDGAGTSASAEARAEAWTKRIYSMLGLLGVYLCWTIFSWFIFTYGMLIYKTLGDKAQQEFAKTWGIGYGMDNATEWQEVFKTAAKTALILVILDLLRLSKNASWFEEHVDFVSMQAVLFNGAAKSWWQQTRTLVRLQARLTED